MRILAIIPARGGSKGVPRKNLKLLAGKPLLQYTIETAQACTSIDQIFFSSENQELVDLACKSGLNVPFLRPDHLAADQSGTLEVLQHVVEELRNRGDVYDAICLLQVTNPFRTPQLVEQAIQRFKEGTFDSLISVLAVPHEYNPHWVFEPREDGALAIATGEPTIIKRRQELPVAFYRDGAIYLMTVNTLMKENSLYGSHIGYIESDASRHVNIDTMEDWKNAEELVQKLET
jgi:N-acylneuraminate cytidylyltransferase